MTGAHGLLIVVDGLYDLPADQHWSLFCCCRTPSNTMLTNSRGAFFFFLQGQIEIPRRFSMNFSKLGIKEWFPRIKTRGVGEAVRVAIVQMGRGARKAAGPPNYRQLRFFGQQEKIWAKPVFKDISMLPYYFEEINIFYLNLKLA